MERRVVPFWNESVPFCSTLTEQEFAEGTERRHLGREGHESYRSYKTNERYAFAVRLDALVPELAYKWFGL